MIQLFYLILAVIAPLSRGLNEPIVKTSYGDIQGLTTVLPTKKSVDYFLGIPYATPPLGSLRFAPPQPVSPWTGTLKVSQKAPGCIQEASQKEKETLWFVSNQTESEDCLYMNIWRPTVMKDKMAVMVWIHGGLYVSGSGSMSLYDGSILATEQDVIVVTINFRLSIFGMLYLGVPGAMGNAILQDQILALKWVQDNIANFGGDPNKVTLFGESSGAVSIGHHLTNPNVQSLFNNAILQSGSPNVEQGVQTADQGIAIATKTAPLLGCTDTDKTAILNCLISKSASDLMKTFNSIPPYSFSMFLPITNGLEVCTDVQNCTSMIPVEKRKPIIIGTNKDEMNFHLTFFFPGTQIDDDTIITESQWKQAISVALSLNDKLIHLLTNLYGPYNPQQVKLNAGSFFSDLLICPANLFAKQYVSDNTYMYSYNHPLSEPNTQMPEWVGTVQGDEIPYVFGAPLDLDNEFTFKELLLSKNVMAYWARFAKTNNPNGGAPTRSVWRKFDLKTLSYLSLDIKTYSKSDLRGKECANLFSTLSDLIALQTKLNQCK